MRTSTFVAVIGVAASCSAYLLAQTPPPTFRSGVDLIAVEVEVVDRGGAPVAGLVPDQFQISIDGKRRKVASADLIDATKSAAPNPPPSAEPHASPPLRDRADDGRIYILAFDTLSFQGLDVAPAREAARAFVESLPPNDISGLFVFPEGQVVDLSTNRAPLLQAIDQVVGHASPVVDPNQLTDPYQLTPSELVDLTLVPPGFEDPAALDRAGYTTLAARIKEICVTDRDPEMCRTMIVRRAAAIAQFEEMDIAQRLGALEGLFRSLAASQRRKTVVLISAGVMAADRPGGRPDFQNLGRMIGQSAAAAHATVYSLYFDRRRTSRATADRSGARMSNEARDSDILAHPLDQIAGTSGGSFFTVVQGGGEFAFKRILSETSAYYLLGVVPETKDRDGRSHELRVKVAARDATIRGHSWIHLPKPGEVKVDSVPLLHTAPAVRTDSSALTAAPTRLALGTAPPRPLPDAARPLIEAYASRRYSDMERQLLAIRPPDVAALLRDVQNADAPWPAAPRRSRTFALELALEGLAVPNGFAHDAGVKLLARTHLLVEQSPSDLNEFACAWFRAEAAGLESIWHPEASSIFVGRALQHCPRDARLLLARAVMLDQEFGDGPNGSERRQVLDAFAAVPENTDAGLEAHVRAAWFLLRNGDVDGASDLLRRDGSISADPFVRYTYALVNGHVARARNRLDEAEHAYRRALEAWPGAQSGRVALMTLLLSRGHEDQASALGADVLRATSNAVDPWWTYSRGDFRIYTSVINHLREMSE